MSLSVLSECPEVGSLNKSPCLASALGVYQIHNLSKILFWSNFAVLLRSHLGVLRRNFNLVRFKNSSLPKPSLIKLYDNEYALIIDIYFYEYFHWSQTFRACAPKHFRHPVRHFS